MQYYLISYHKDVDSRDNAFGIYPDNSARLKGLIYANHSSVCQIW